MRSAIIEDGIVTNIIVGSLPYSIECSTDVAIGWVYVDNNFIAPVSYIPTFEEVYEDKIQQIESLFNQATKEIQSQYPQAERETWYKQELEAKAYLNDPDNADVSFITKLADKRNKSVDEMAQIILGKIDHYEDVISTAMEKRRKLLQKVNEELTSLEELQNFNVQEEWDKEL